MIGFFKVCFFKMRETIFVFYEKLFYLNSIYLEDYNYISLFKIKTNNYS